MAQPTRHQVEAFLATLPPNQQGPALAEIKRRMSQTQTPQSPGDDFWGRAVSGDPRTAAGSQMTGSDVRRGALTAAGLGAAYAVPAAVGAAIPAVAAYPGALAAVGGGTAAAVEGAGPKGILFGALTGGALTKIGKVWRVAKMLGLVGRPAAAEAGALTQSEMQQVVKQMARGESGAVLNPSVEEVATRMVPRGQLPPMAQGEMTTVTRGVGKPPAGWVENPSPETVAQFMQRPVPSGVDPDAVSALQKWGMSFDDAVRLATKAAPGAAVPVAGSAARATSAATTASAPAVTATTPLMAKPGAAQFEEMLAKALREGQARAALKAASRGQRSLADALGGVTDENALKLLAQGEGVTIP